MAMMVCANRVAVKRERSKKTNRGQTDRQTTDTSDTAQSKTRSSLLVRTMWSSVSAVSCCVLLTIASLVSGQAVISLLEPRNIVSRRPGQFDLSVHKTGAARTPATIIVEVSQYP